MELVNAGALGWLALGVPLALLYLVRPQRLRVNLATDQFWEAASAVAPWRTSLRKLRGWLSLLLHLVLLALLALALAEPSLSLFAGQPRRVVVILDNSASLGAEERWADAKRLADRQLRTLRSCDQAAVILAAAPATVVAGLGDDVRVCRLSVAQATRSDAPGRLADALQLARRMLADLPGSEVLVVTDGCGPEIKSLAASPGVTLLTVGTSRANLGLTAFQARRCFGDPAGYEILVEVRNFSDQPVARNLHILLNGGIIENKVITLPAEGTYRHVFLESRVEGGVLEARLDPGDEFTRDDTAHAVLAPRTPRPITVLTDEQGSIGFFFLNHVLEQCDLVEKPVQVAPSAGASAGPAIPLYFGKVPARLPDGPVLVVSPHNACELWESGAVLADTAVFKSDGPLVANLTKPESLLFTGARLLKKRGDVTFSVAAETIDREPLLFSIERGPGRGRVVVVNGELTEDFPLKTAFPVLMANALTWLTQQGGEGLETATTGKLAYVDLPPDASPECTILSPSQQRLAATASGGRVAVGPLDQSGMWSVVNASGDVLGQVAANVADAGESDLRPQVPATSLLEQNSTWVPELPLWKILVILALVLSVMEWGLYQRRRLA